MQSSNEQQLTIQLTSNDIIPLIIPPSSLPACVSHNKTIFVITNILVS